MSSILYCVSRKLYSESSIQFDHIAREILCTASARIIAISKPVIKHFEKLIDESKDDEQIFQDFLTKYPQLIDPMAIQIWPQPNLHGAKEPDFVVRRVDDSYLIVEIERPSKPLVTAGLQLSAEVTHAERQVVDYKTFLMQRFQDACRHFPMFDEPDCLVVVGLESELNAQQKTVLANANRQRHRLRIVGFDWLAHRSATITGNIIQNGVEVTRLRMV